MGSVGRLLAASVVMLAGFVAVSAPAVADQPNSRTRVTHTSRLDIPLTGRISSASDQDWYRFRVPRSTRYLVRLTYLPANLRLDVFDAHGKRFAKSIRPWHQFEEIYRYFRAGIYYVRVASQDGTYSKDRAYRLRFASLAPGLRVLSVSRKPVRTADGEVAVFCDMLNNTSRWKIIVDSEIERVDEAGTAYAHADASNEPDVVGPRRHTTCMAEFSRRLLSRFDHARVVVRSYQTTRWRDWPIAVRPTFATSDPRYGTTFHGYLRNDGRKWLASPSVVLSFYGPSGRVIDSELDDGGEQGLAPGASAPYVVTSRLAGPHALILGAPSANGMQPRV